MAAANMSAALVLSQRHLHQDKALIFMGLRPLTEVALPPESLTLLPTCVGMWRFFSLRLD
jgi:hypothetical protein